jgi:2-keto-3-deoxy-L-rhamnonate aldolase RhmA
MARAFPNQAKHQLEAGQLAIGLILRQARTVDIAAIARTCGFDWLSIDMEHTSLDMDTAAQVAAAALPAGVTALVRIPGKEPHHATRLLDAGAQGVIVPHVDTAEDARFFVEHCFYPPLGRRSIASVQPQLGFQTVSGEEAMRAVNAQTLLVAMLETPNAIGNADAIAAVPGVDVLLIGTHDLCAEMGIAGQFGDPRLKDAYRRVTEACKSRGKHAGMAGLHDPKLATEFVEMGVRFIGGGTDLSFLMAGARERASFLRGLLK